MAAFGFESLVLFARSYDTTWLGTGCVCVGTAGDEDVHHGPPTGRGSRRDRGGVRKLGALRAGKGGCYLYIYIYTVSGILILLILITLFIWCMEALRFVFFSSWHVCVYVRIIPEE